MGQVRNNLVREIELASDMISHVATDGLHLVGNIVIDCRALDI
jgi:hypothetical protein